MRMTPALAIPLESAVALLGSGHEGEVVAAARAIRRTLETAGRNRFDFAP